MVLECVAAMQHWWAGLSVSEGGARQVTRCRGRRRLFRATAW